MFDDASFLALTAFLNGLGLAASASASAQQPAAPAPGATAATQPILTTAVYDDRVALCASGDTGRVHEVVQNIQAQGQGLIASVAVGRTDAKAPPVVPFRMLALGATRLTDHRRLTRAR